MLLQTSTAIAYLHSLELIHRDIKTQNIILDRNLNIFLCDFGFARHASDKQQAMTICGTDEFMAPEVIFGMEYGIAADVFSFGVVACEMIARKVPGEGGFLDRQPKDGFALNIDDVQNLAPPKLPASLLELTEKCCSHAPEDRPSANDAANTISELLKTLPSSKSVPLYIGGATKWCNCMEGRGGYLSSASILTTSFKSEKYEHGEKILGGNSGFDYSRKRKM